MRYLPNSPADREAMLSATGLQKIEQLFEQKPEKLRLTGRLNLRNVFAERSLVSM